MVKIYSANLNFLLSMVVYFSAELSHINARVKTITLARLLLEEVKTGYSGFSPEPTESPRSAHAQPTLSPRSAHAQPTLVLNEHGGGDYKIINN